MIKLVLTVGKEHRVRIFSDADLLIGTGRDCDLVVSEPGVAERHCRIERIAFGYKLVDLESPEGTTVNDEAITQKRLKTGDKIGLGSALVIYFQRAPERIEAIIRAEARDQAPPRGPDPDELRRRLNEVLDRYYNVLGDEGLAEVDQIVQGHLTRRGLGYTDQLLEREERLLRLQNINKELAKERDERRLLALVLDSAVELTGAERGFLLLNKANKRGLRVEVARNFDQESIKKPTYKISRSIADEVSNTGEALVVTDAIQDERFVESMSVLDLKLRSVICFPLKTRGEILGVIYLDNRFQAGTFGDRETRILEMFADQASIALLNARHYGRPATEESADDAAPPPPTDARTAEMAAYLEQPDVNRERATKYPYREIIAAGPAMTETLTKLDRIIPSEAPVLIRGESGTGKELIARAIHQYGPRKEKPFVSENCAAIPETLLESELFGHTKGAFTGADRNKEGLFQQANGGTLFLDEIGDMPAHLQTKLLRALERGEIRPVGSGQTIAVDVRIISATNQDLERMIKDKSFREDLFYRLNVFAVDLPPLRDRWEDIPLLVSHFIEEATPSGADPRPVGDDAMLALMLYPWPGNIRELRNEVLRAVTLGDGPIEASDLSETVRPVRRPLKHIVQDVERRVIALVLARTRWKKTDAARLLGISRPTLDARIESLGLVAPA